MTTPETEIDRYLEGLPADRRLALASWRSLLREALRRILLETSGRARGHE